MVNPYKTLYSLPRWTHDKSNLGEILKTTSQTLTTQVTASEERAARAEAESRIEREWRISLQEKELKLKEKISNLQGCLKELAEEKERNGKLKADLDKVRTQWSEAQTTLDYLQALIEHRDDSLYDYYEPHALMMSDEV